MENHVVFVVRIICYVVATVQGQIASIRFALCLQKCLHDSPNANN